MSGVEAAWRRLVRLADRVDDAGRRGRLPEHSVPAIWAVFKLAVLAVLLPVIGPWVAARAAINHRRAKAWTDRMPTIVDAVLAGTPHSYPVARVQRRAAAERWFVVSDLHRMPPGRLDWPTRQHSRELYDAALDHYAAGGWGLIENGDIEDHWLVGGSAYGVCQDVARMVAGLLPSDRRAALGQAITSEHLRRIHTNYAPTYERVRSGFHEHGRFVRLTGNHDDVYEVDGPCGSLGELFPGLEPCDFVVLEDDGVPVGIVFHGHQTDGWNGPVFPNLVARVTTSLASALHDLPGEGLTPGLPGPAVTRQLLDGRVRNRLTRVNGLTGATIGFESLDEVRLFEAFRRHAGGADGSDLDGGPWVILGHTHIPLAAPEHPVDGGRWWRYRNGGSGITHGLLTGVEWDGTVDARSPEVRLVGWTRDDDGGMRRLVFEPGGSTLRPRGIRAGETIASG